MPQPPPDRIVLILGSAPDATACRSWPRERFSAIVAINNAWRIREDWDYLIAPDDFPRARRPHALKPGQTMVGSDIYVPANNRFGGVFYAGGTMAFTAGYWALWALKPSVLAFLGCDMVYPAAGRTHFYGQGAPDPLRADPSLRSLEAKSARLMLHGARQGCACVRLSAGASRLIFPGVPYDGLGEAGVLAPAVSEALFDQARREEQRLGYFVETGRYWEASDQISVAEVDALDELWLRAAGIDGAGWARLKKGLDG